MAAGCASMPLHALHAGAWWQEVQSVGSHHHPLPPLGALSSLCPPPSLPPPSLLHAAAQGPKGQADDVLRDPQLLQPFLHLLLVRGRAMRACGHWQSTSQSLNATCPHGMALVHGRRGGVGGCSPLVATWDGPRVTTRALRLPLACPRCLTSALQPHYQM